jgi:hypothetical protein
MDWNRLECIQTSLNMDEHPDFWLNNFQKFCRAYHARNQTPSMESNRRVRGPSNVPVALTGQRLRHSWPHLLGRQRSSTTTAIRLDLPDILLLPVTQHNLCSCAGFAGLAGSGWRLLINLMGGEFVCKMAAGRWAAW